MLAVAQADNTEILSTHCSMISSGSRSKGGGEMGVFSMLDRRPSVVKASMTLALYCEDLGSMSDGTKLRRFGSGEARVCK